jgi:hypothetical protein
MPAGDAWRSALGYSRGDAMRLEDIAPEELKRVAKFRWDRIVEKHEGPWEWEYLLEAYLVEFLNVNGFEVLLPVEKEHHPQITISRCIVSADQQTLTIFLRDTTYDTGIFAGYLAVCEKVPDQAWYIAILYHECWVHQLGEGT